MSNRRGGSGTNLIGGAVVVALVVLIGISLGIGKSTCLGRLSASMADVLDQTKYGNDALLTDITPFSYDDRGEIDHPLINPGGNPVKATIQRLSGSGKRKASCFDNHPSVVAVIHSDGDFGTLNFVANPKANWFVVWHDTGETDPKKAWHGAILNEQNRKEITFEYKAHWQSNKPSDVDSPTADPPSELVPQLQDCWKATSPRRRACFGDLPKPTATADAGTGLGLRMFVLREDNSVPWVACAQAGCCCGGTGCHEEK